MLHEAFSWAAIKKLQIYLDRKAFLKLFHGFFFCEIHIKKATYHKLPNKELLCIAFVWNTVNINSMLESGCIVKNLALTKEKVWPLPLASARLSPGPWNVMPDRCASVCLGAWVTLDSPTAWFGGVDGGFGDVERMPTFIEEEGGDWPSQKDQNM